jgi:hypothetical protein
LIVPKLQGEGYRIHIAQGEGGHVTLPDIWFNIMKTMSKLYYNWLSVGQSVLRTVSQLVHWSFFLFLITLRMFWVCRCWAPTLTRGGYLDNICCLAPPGQSFTVSSPRYPWQYFTLPNWRYLQTGEQSSNIYNPMKRLTQFNLQALGIILTANLSSL